jgi:translation initiation factor 2B subunit (eIF-2B alpha/beta/delta family)
MSKSKLWFNSIKSIMINYKYNCSLKQAKLFSDEGIPTKFISDNSVAVIMEEVDLCLVGAEGVMENGGIINKVIHI